MGIQPGGAYNILHDMRTLRRQLQLPCLFFIMSSYGDFLLVREQSSAQPLGLVS